ncbi:AAA family ATPase [Klebsiella pneumoniae]|uniref:AAA family ATPase n=1 Tax=Klebsiella pneumoniae TaxID=573 RepID=UPI001F52AEBF|nr:AAA family ATPase [Klebsiella pneumoniae]
MIKEISLKNFKCVNELYLKQLKTLNIIAGKNNYGKTSILDAIFCFCHFGLVTFMIWTHHKRCP